MENATRALIMAASVLIAMMVIGIGTYVFNTFSTFSKEEEERLYEFTLTEFNVQFTKYETIEEIDIHDIVSLANYARNYNDSNQVTNESDPIYIDVNIKLIKNNLENLSSEEKNDLIKKSINEGTKYILDNDGIEYNTVTGKVTSITFRKID